jgi:hypothetical protein
VLTGTGPRSVGVWLAGHQQIVSGNQVGAYTCVEGNPVDTPTEAGAANVSVVANRCAGGAGPKVVIQGPGWLVAENYLAWGTTAPAPVIAIGGAGTRGAPAGHAAIVANSLHTDRPGGTLVGFVDPGPRCQGGRRAGEACTSEAPDSCPEGRCARAEFSYVVIASNSLLAGDVGVDLSALGRGTVVTGLDVTGNQFTPLLSTGIRFPAGDGQVRAAHVAANQLAGVRAPLVGWRWTMGERDGNGPLTAADDAVEVVYLTQAGSAPGTPGDAVEVDATADGAFRPAVSHPARVLGVLLDAPAPGATGRVAIRGTTTCNVTDGPIERGDRLGVSDTPGRLAPAGRRNPALALALTGRRPGDAQTVRCLITR